MAPDPHEHAPGPDCRAARARLRGDAEELPPPLAEHVSGCAACRGETDRLRAAWTLLGALNARKPSPRFAAGVWAKIARTDAGRRRRATPARTARWAAAAVALVAAIAIPVGIISQRTHDSSVTDECCFPRPELVAQLDLVESHELLANLDVVEELDVLLLLDEP
jgi:predicted anti-sigma-YlaC factor YlaD